MCSPRCFSNVSRGVTASCAGASVIVSCVRASVLFDFVGYVFQTKYGYVRISKPSLKKILPRARKNHKSPSKVAASRSGRARTVLRARVETITRRYVRWKEIHVYVSRFSSAGRYYFRVRSKSMDDVSKYVWIVEPRFVSYGDIELFFDELHSGLTRRKKN